MLLNNILLYIFPDVGKNALQFPSVFYVQQQHTYTQYAENVETLFTALVKNPRLYFHTRDFPALCEEKKLIIRLI